MSSDHDTLRDEYPEDLIKSGVRGKYAKKYREGTNIVLIDPDLHSVRVFLVEQITRHSNQVSSALPNGLVRYCGMEIDP